MKFIVSCLLVILIPLVGFSASPAQTPQSAVSFSILPDIVKNLLPADFKIQSIVTAGMDSHGHEPTAKEYLAFKKADLIILAGNNFEPWAVQAIEKVHAKGPVYFFASEIPLLPLIQDDDEHEPVHGHGTKSSAGSSSTSNLVQNEQTSFDPHVWQSPDVMDSAISKLSTYLQKLYPGSATEIKTKTTTYLNELKRVQNKFKNEFAKIPKEKRQIVIAHNSFQYFAKEFDVGVSSPLDSSQEGDTSIAKISELVKKIKSDKIQSLFFEKSAPQSLMKNISRETGVDIKGTLYSDCLSTNDEANTYLKMLDYNFNLILKSMKGSPR